MPPWLPVPVGVHFSHPPPLQSDGQHLCLTMMTLTMVVVVIISIHIFVIMKPLLQVLVIPSYANSERACLGQS